MSNLPTLRTLAEQDSRALALYLKQHLKLHGLTGTAASRALERSPAYLTQVFSGQVPLKLKDLFGALAQTRPHPQVFFDRVYTRGSAPPRQPSSPLAKLEDLGLRVERPAYRRSARETTDRAGHLLSAWIVGAGQKQRRISRELGLGEDTLAKALRNETDLTAWHLFGVLRAIGAEPAAFFEELLAVEEPHGLTEDEARLLARVLETTLRGLSAKTGTGQNSDGRSDLAPDVKPAYSDPPSPGKRPRNPVAASRLR